MAESKKTKPEAEPGTEAPQAAPEPTGKPDALLLTDGGKWGGGVRAKTNAVSDFADPILGARSYVRKHYGRMFVTASPHDTFMMPLWHEDAGRARYRWVDKGNGVEYGYLAEGAPTAKEIEEGNGGHSWT